MRSISWLRPIALLAVALLSSQGADGSDGTLLWDRRSVLTFNEENDLFVNSDRHYTQGINLAYLHEDGHLPLGMASINEWIPSWGYQRQSARSGYSIGQSMFTPANLSSTQPIPGDRPYAGWLHGSWILQRSGQTASRRTPVQESFELEIGSMGSTSLARQAQRWVHDVRGFELPEGWRNQLRDEPGFRLKYERAYRWALFNPHQTLQCELIPWGGGVAGTIEDSLRVGGQIRIGVGLQNDFGIRTIDSLSTTGGGRSRNQPRNWSIHGLVGAEGKAVARNAFLDGNLWRDSLSVDKQALVGDFHAGVVATLKWLEAGYIHVFRTPEFRQQNQSHQFGSVYVKLLF